jgi:hypothetical protein
MMKTILRLIIAFLLPLIGRAEDIKLPAGPVYKNAKIIRSDAASVTIQHSSGIARVMIPDLPEELRSKYPYDSEAAKKLLTLESDAGAERSRRDAQTMENSQATLARLTIEQLLREIERNDENSALAIRKARRVFQDFHWVTVWGKIISVVDEGLIVSCQPAYTRISPELLLGDALREIPDSIAPPPISGTVLLHIPRSVHKFVDGDGVAIVASPSEKIFRYTTVIGADTSIRSYDIVWVK